MALMSVAAAKDLILENAFTTDEEDCPPIAAHRRVLARDLTATLTQPPFAASAMDGYAIQAVDLQSAPVTLPVIGVSAAGHPFAGKLGAGEAVRIFTGAVLPEGADTIVIQENTEVSADGKSVKFLSIASKGLHVRPRGYDFEAGQVLLRAGEKLSARQLMLAAAMNHAAVPVRKKPKVALLANGDELVPPGGEPGEGQIISSIPSALAPAIACWGGEPKLLPIARDTPSSIAACLDEAGDVDIIVTIGGASVGEHDLARRVLEDRGVAFQVLKIAMRPGKPLMFGKHGRQLALALPGNPVSAVICARIFLKPLIERMLGHAHGEAILHAPLAAPLEANGEREHYMRATMEAGAVAAIPDQDSSLMRAFASANCLIVREPYAPALVPPAEVRVIPLDF